MIAQRPCGISRWLLRTAAHLQCSSSASLAMKLVSLPKPLTETLRAGLIGSVELLRLSTHRLYIGSATSVIKVSVE